MRTIPSSELIINDDGSIFHLHLKPEQLADIVILVGDPGRVAMVASFFDTQECSVSNREFNTVTGTYNENLKGAEFGFCGRDEEDLSR